MAIVDGPALSLRASGNVGQICFARWRGVQIARDRWTGTQPNIGQQAVVQGYMRTVSRAWSTYLTKEQRNWWGEFARSQKWANKLGLRWTPTGYLAFVSLGLHSMNLAGTYEMEPPVRLYRALPSVITVSQPGWELMVRVAMSGWAGAVEPDKMQVWRAGPFTGGGYHAQSGDYRVVQVVGAPFSWDDWGLVDGMFYWYKLRWGFNVGIVGVMYEEQVYVLELPPP